MAEKCVELNSGIAVLQICAVGRECNSLMSENGPSIASGYTVLKYPNSKQDFCSED